LSGSNAWNNLSFCLWPAFKPAAIYPWSDPRACGYFSISL
jgi:hypothetical protein